MGAWWTGSPRPSCSTAQAPPRARPAGWQPRRPAAGAQGGAASWGAGTPCAARAPRQPPHPDPDPRTPQAHPHPGNKGRGGFAGLLSPDPARGGSEVCKQLSLKNLRESRGMARPGPRPVCEGQVSRREAEGASAWVPDASGCRDVQNTGSPRDPHSGSISGVKSFLGLPILLGSLGLTAQLRPAPRPQSPRRVNKYERRPAGARPQCLAFITRRAGRAAPRLGSRKRPPVSRVKAI